MSSLIYDCLFRSNLYVVLQSPAMSALISKQLNFHSLVGQIMIICPSIWSGSVALTVSSSQQLHLPDFSLPWTLLHVTLLCVLLCCVSSFFWGRALGQSKHSNLRTPVYDHQITFQNAYARQGFAFGNSFYCIKSHFINYGLPRQMFLKSFRNQVNSY